MDIATAKTLVSAALVIAIALFSIVSVEMLVASVIRDLKAGWAQRAGAEGSESEPSRPAA